MKHFYDAQFRRYLLQVVRAFSHFEVSENDGSGGERFIRVPCRMGDPSRMVASIISGNSDNILNTLPMITVGIQAIAADPTRRLNPYFSRTDQFSEREYDSQLQQYNTKQGNLYSVTRYMPVPYVMTVQVDIFTSNLDNKFQLMEQIMVLFNPGIQLSLNSNPIDWANITEIEMTNIIWSNRGIPRGTEEIIDMATITFDVKVYISPPALVKRQRIINAIIADMHLVNSISNLGFSREFYNFFEQLSSGERVIVTPNDYKLDVSNNGNGGNFLNIIRRGVADPWEPLIEMYGTIKAESRVVLNLTDNLENDAFFVTGTISPVEGDPLLLNFVIDEDSLPTDTLPEFDAFIDPSTNYPGDGILPAAQLGQRYVVLANVPQIPEWGVNANEGDIIEFNGTTWVVSFNSGASVDAQWAVNNADEQQWKWNGKEWIHSYRGTYNAGFWRLIL
jgi:hypothetical protein